MGRAVVALAGAAVLTAAALTASPGVGVVAVVAVPLAAAAAAWRALAALARLRRGRAGRRSSAPLGIAMIEIAAVMATAVAGLSWAEAMGRPSNSTLGIRTVEWLRDQGGAGLVSWIEGIYYTSTAPAKGGARLRSLPAVGAATTLASAPTTARPRPAPTHQAPMLRPARVRPLIQPALPGEGIWTVTQGRFARARRPPVLVTAYRPAPDYPRLVAGLAWFDHRRTRVSLYAGLQEPPGGATPGGAQVPLSARARLLATFNSGFKHGDSGGGFFANGRLIEPMVAGQGTIVSTQDGRVDVRAWRGGPRPGAGVTFARQNLPLIVDDGRLSPNLSDPTRWGATLGNEVLVWRSGVGVDRHGNLIYAAGQYLGVAGLGGVLVHAGAVRAIELDINTYWVTCNTYGLPGARAARSLLPTMQRSPERYLTPDDRDFFAVYER